MKTINKNEEFFRDYARGMLVRQLDYYAKHRPELFAKVTEELKENFINRTMEDARKFAEGVEQENDWFMQSLDYGVLHPDNKTSRKLFEDLTGISLPPTVTGTHKVVNEYFSESLSAYRKRKAAEAEENARLEAEAEAKEKQDYIEGVLSKIKAKELVDGRELVDAARHLGIEVPIQTAGMLIKRVRSIGMIHGQIAARIDGKQLSDKGWRIYFDVAKSLEEVPA